MGSNRGLNVQIWMPFEQIEVILQCSFPIKSAQKVHIFFALISVYVIYRFGQSQFRKMDPKRRRLNAKPNDIMILPLELWKKIFENLKFRDVLACSKVCCQWSKVALRYFINPQLKVFASLRPELDAFLQEKGWNEEWLDVDLIEEVFKKIIQSAFLFLINVVQDR